MILPVNLGKDSYDITLGRGQLSHAGAVFNLERKVFLVMDNGVPQAYAEKIAAQK